MTGGRSGRAVWPRVSGVLVAMLSVLACGGKAAEGRPVAAPAASGATAAQDPPGAALDRIAAEQQLELERDEARLPTLEEQVREELDGAQVTIVEAPTDRQPLGTAAIVWEGLRLRVGYRQYGEGQTLDRSETLEAARFLRELAEAGVVLDQTGRYFATAQDGVVDCAVSYDTGVGQCRRAPPSVRPPPGPLDLTPPAALVPPSQRRRSRRVRARASRRTRPGAVLTTPTVQRIAAVLAAHDTFALRGFALDTTHRLLLVTFADLEIEGMLVCVSDSDRPTLECVNSPIDSIASVAPTPDGGWLVVGETSWGNQRDLGRLLVSLLVTDEGLVSSGLTLGGMAGNGESCEGHPGYCVWVEAAAHEARLLSPTCIGWRSGSAWTATHVRVGDRWIDENVTPAVPNCSAHFEVSGGRFSPSTCGGAVTGTPCSEDESFGAILF